MFFISLHSDMYTLREIIRDAGEQYAGDIWEGHIACQFVEEKFIPSGIDYDGFSVFSFLLVLKGCISVEYKKKKIEVVAGEVHTYAPGIPTKVISVSDDYEACLLHCDKQFIYDTPTLNHVVRVAFFPGCRIELS